MQWALIKEQVVFCFGCHLHVTRYVHLARDLHRYENGSNAYAVRPASTSCVFISDLPKKGNARWQKSYPFLAPFIWPFVPNAYTPLIWSFICRPFIFSTPLSTKAALAQRRGCGVELRPLRESLLFGNTDKRKANNPFKFPFHEYKHPPLLIKAKDGN